MYLNKVSFFFFFSNLIFIRFQLHVSQELEKQDVKVIELIQPMNPSMIGIQKILMEMIHECLNELRKDTSIDISEFTLERVLFKTFDLLVQQELNPIWDQLNSKTHQLIQDLKLLRKLIRLG
jgi:DNA excision repair protein ERCC-4